MMRGILSYICPKRKCRHTWQASFVDVICDADCPQCGAKGLSPVDVEDLSYERTMEALA